MVCASTSPPLYFLFISLYTASVFLFDRLEKSNHAYESFWAWALQAAVLLGVLYYMVDEVWQFWNDHREQIKVVVRRRQKRVQQLLASQGAAELPSAPPDVPELQLEPGQHRKLNLSETITKIAKAATAPPVRPNPAAYSGSPYYVVVYLQLQAFLFRESAVRFLANIGPNMWLAWKESILRMVMRHFSGFWNLVDLAVIGIVTAGTVVRILHRQETDSSRCILSVGSVVVWFKVLNFMRPFKRSGPLSECCPYSSLCCPIVCA